jgi:GntR family transcriptional regulator
VSDEATLVIDRGEADAVYEQIARQIRDRIAAGELLPGEELPPVRVLASDLGVSLNTVARAYRLLEDEGFLTIRERSGAVVAAPPARPEDELQQRLQVELREAVLRLRQAGTAPAAIVAVVEATLALPGEGPR